MTITLDGTTGVTAPALTGSIDASNLTGVLPAIDGSALTGLISNLDLISTSTVTSPVSSVDITSGFDSGVYAYYKFTFTNVIPDTDTEFEAKFSTDGGSTFATSGYSSTRLRWGDGLAPGVFSSTVEVVLTTAVGTDVNEFGATGEFNVFSQDGSVWSFGYGKTTYTQSDSTLGATLSDFHYASTSSINGIRFSFNLGNIESGIIRMYGVKK